MQISDLKAFDIAATILAIWSKTIGPVLLPIQVRAVLEGLFKGERLVIFSPTGSGKTFVGEMAAVVAASRDKRVIYLVPQRALAEEKFHEFESRYRPAGFKVVVSSRDHREFDQDIVDRNFHIAVVVYEKLQALLVSNPHLLDIVGVVVIDELQMITDPSRGPDLEFLTTQIRNAASKPQIIGLSAVLEKAQPLADWLGAKLLVDRVRPVELRKGVLCRGKFTYVEHNTGAAGVEEFTDFDIEDPGELLLAHAEDFVRRGFQILVFLPKKADTVRAARMTAYRLQRGPAEKALEELRELEPDRARDNLIETLSSGVAFHNADLTRDKRHVVEDGYRSGEIRAIFCTTTLSMGMNLPAQIVLMVPDCVSYSATHKGPVPRAMSKSEFENTSGRAGRFGLAKGPGMAMLVTWSPIQADAYMSNYIRADFDSLNPTLGKVPLEDFVLSVVATNLASTREGIAKFLLSTFTGWLEWSREEGAGTFKSRVEAAIDLCVSGGLLCGETTLSLTRVGKACATKSLGVRTGIAFAAWAREAGGNSLSPLEVLTMAAMSPSGLGVVLKMPKKENRNAYRHEMVRCAGATGVLDRPLFQAIAAPKMGPEEEAARAMKKALASLAWIEEADARTLESRFQVWMGNIESLGQEMAWLVDTLAPIADACDWPPARVAELATLAARLSFGVREDALELARLRVDRLSRGLIRALVEKACGEIETLRSKSEAELHSMIRHPRAVKNLYQVLHAGDAEVIALRAVEHADEPAAPAQAAEPEEDYRASPPAAQFQGLSVDTNTWTVSYRGVPIPTSPAKGVKHLQRGQVEPLAALAERPGVPMDEEALGQGIKRLGGVRRRRVPALVLGDVRYRIMSRLRPALRGKFPDAEIERIVEFIPNVGLRLGVPARLIVPESSSETRKAS